MGDVNLVYFSDIDGNPMLLNVQYIVAVTEQGLNRGSRIRVRDGTVYDVRETVAEVYSRMPS